MRNSVIQTIEAKNERVEKELSQAAESKSEVIITTENSKTHQETNSHGNVQGTTTHFLVERRILKRYPWETEFAFVKNFRDEGDGNCELDFAETIHYYEKAGVPLKVAKACVTEINNVLAGMETIKTERNRRCGSYALGICIGVILSLLLLIPFFIPKTESNKTTISVLCGVIGGLAVLSCLLGCLVGRFYSSWSATPKRKRIDRRVTSTLQKWGLDKVSEFRAIKAANFTFHGDPEKAYHEETHRAGDRFLAISKNLGDGRGYYATVAGEGFVLKGSPLNVIAESVHSAEKASKAGSRWSSEDESEFTLNEERERLIGSPASEGNARQKVSNEKPKTNLIPVPEMD